MYIHTINTNTLHECLLESLLQVSYYILKIYYNDNSLSARYNPNNIHL